jgi:hypothetical protein
MREPLTLLAVVFTLFIGGIIALCNWGEENQCANQAALMGVEYRYSFNTPCMVKANGQFVPLSAFKVLQ